MGKGLFYSDLKNDLHNTHRGYIIQNKRYPYRVYCVAVKLRTLTASVEDGVLQAPRISDKQRRHNLDGNRTYL